MSSSSDHPLHHSTDCAELARIDAMASHKPVRTQSGITVYWRRFGMRDGAPLILLHGGHGNWAHWVRNVEALGMTRTVWVVDLPGFGRSSSLPSNADLDLLVDTLKASIDVVLGETSAIDICGFSFGALVASILATRRPVGRVALLGSAGHGRARLAYAPPRQWRRAPDAASRTADFDFNLQTYMLHRPRAGDLALCAYEEACLQARFRKPQPFAIGYLTQLLLQANETQKMLMWGDHDVTLADPRGFSDELQLEGVDHTFELIERAGHWVQFEQSEVVNARILEWFA